MKYAAVPLAALASLVAAAQKDFQPSKISAEDFGLYGYAKENPRGETTGGAGGITTTVSSFNALKTAVTVRCIKP